MTVSRLEYSDILKVSEIEKECFKNPWDYKMFADTFLSGNFYGFIAKKNGEICGFGGFIYSGESADITKIAVLESYRRQKIASEILKEIINCAKDLKASDINLEVRVTNQTAILLYEKFGFEIIGRRKKYYGDEDAFVMQYIFKE